MFNVSKSLKYMTSEDASGYLDTNVTTLQSIPNFI